MSSIKELVKKTRVHLMDGTEIVVKPLKIAYLKDVMEKFDTLKQSESEDESMDIILDCVAICMRQLYPKLKTRDQVADSIDMNTLYEILGTAAGIHIDPTKEKSVQEQVATEMATKKVSEDTEPWEGFDLMKYELQAFLLGIWKSIDELEMSISLPELTQILSANNEQQYSDRKFFAAIQGIDLEGGKSKEEDKWEALKSRVAEKTSGIKVADSNDITSFQGIKARQAGFGIGMGLDYEKID